MDFNIYKSFLDHLEMSVFVLDAEGRYLYVNPFYCKTTNKTIEFFMGTSIPKLKEQGYLKNSAYDIVCATGTTANALISVKNDISGIPYDTLTTSIPLYSKDGVLQYIFCTQEPLQLLTTRLRQSSYNRVNVDYGVESMSDGLQNIIAESPQMKQILDTIKQIAKTDVSILVTGPSGSGKEVIARYIHSCSTRNNAPLVTLNCSAIPESLIESELFGYTKGAFTGASASGKTGLIESADGGTLFLDEINSIPKNIQVKLLRVLETRQVTPIGSTKPKEVNFRLICASNEDLKKLVDQNLFRADLYYRINVFSLAIPPLNERKEDIIPLATHYCEIFCKKYKCIHFLDETLLRNLETMRWEGNVRELRNFIERLIVSTPHDVLQIRECPDIKGSSEVAAVNNTIPADTIKEAAPLMHFDEDFSYREYMNRCEKQLLEKALAELGSPQKVAEAFELNLSSVYRKIQKYGLVPKKSYS